MWIPSADCRRDHRLRGLSRRSSRIDHATTRLASTRPWPTSGEDDFLWIGISDPHDEEMRSPRGALGLHPLGSRTRSEPHQRPRVDRFSDHLFMSLRIVSTATTTSRRTRSTSAWAQLPADRAPRRTRAVDGAPPGRVDARAASHGPTAALYAVVDAIVDRYEEVAAELETDVEEVESSVFSTDRSNDSTRIYRLKRETFEFRRAVMPLRDPDPALRPGAPIPRMLRPYFRDIGDHLARAPEAIDSIDSLLYNALNAHLAQLSVQQNEDMRKLTAGATIFAVPTAIAGIYGMNFEHMPELTWTYGYPLCLAAMGGAAATSTGASRGPAGSEGSADRDGGRHDARGHQHERRAHPRATR